ncbi:hypothetical protein ISS37_08255 [candidate division KSB1 bacterium]|nr:hypothetical protein [candidate division KSB1 bacterium]
MEAYEFLLKHSKELSEKYPVKYLAIIGNEVAAISNSTHEAYKKVKAKYPDKKVHISYMPTPEEVNILI